MSKATLGLNNKYLEDKHLFDIQDAFLALGEKAGVSLDDVAPLKDHFSVGEALAYVAEIGQAAKQDGSAYSIFTIDDNNNLVQTFTNDVEDAEVCDVNETIY